MMVLLPRNNFTTQPGKSNTRNHKTTALVDCSTSQNCYSTTHNITIYVTVDSLEELSKFQSKFGRALSVPITTEIDIRLLRFLVERYTFL